MFCVDMHSPSHTAQRIPTSAFRVPPVWGSGKKRNKDIAIHSFAKRSDEFTEPAHPAELLPGLLPWDVKKIPLPAHPFLC